MADEVTPLEPVEEPAPVEIPSGGWTGPTQEEWNQLQKQNEQLGRMVGQLFEPDEQDPFPQGEFDPNDPMQIAALIGAVVDDRMRGVTPYVRASAQDQGKREMEKLLDDHAKNLSKDFPAGFDKDLAERAAFYFFDQSGDAEQAVAEAARYAAEVRKTDREAALEETRARATRRGSGASDEAPAAGTAVAGREPAHSYDEVIERYTHQTEV